jgi:ribosome-associated translation inhibitor RaiA/cold shock CspA family protein
MKQGVHIQFLGMEASAALQARAEELAKKLDSLASSIMACRVTIDLLQKHRNQGRPFGVRIDLTLPGHELVVNRVQNEDAYVALRDAFDGMKRQLEELVRIRRGQEKLHAVPIHGELVRLHDDGFGFIRTPAGDEYYFNRDNVTSPPFEHLQTGNLVQFIPELGRDGLQARRVSVGKHGMG